MESRVTATSFLKGISTYRNVILYFMIGASAAVVDVMLYSMLHFEFGLPAFFATTLSIGTATVYAFTLNAFGNFKKSDRLLRRFSSYALISCTGLVFSAAVIFILVDVLGCHALLIKLSTLPLVFVLQYTLNRKFSFHDFEEKQRPSAGGPAMPALQ